MRALLWVVSLLVTGALVAGCGSSDSGRDVSAADLKTTTYTSTSVTGHDLVPGSTITLSFQNGTLTADAGCNSMSATFAVGDGQLRWTGPVASTSKACSDELTAQDQWLSDLLTKGVHGKRDGDKLTLTSGDVTIELTKA